MKILLDESVPLLVKKKLPELDIATVQEMGWAGLQNGRLLQLAEQQFEVFLTADKNLRYQQNLSARILAIIVLPTNQVAVVSRMIPAIQQALSHIQAGDFIELPLPSLP